MHDPHSVQTSDVPMDEYNGAVPAVPAGATVGELFAAQVARCPDAVALVDGGRSWTYAEVELISGRLAGRLAELGVGPETVVGVLMERSADLVLSLLAIAAAGVRTCR